MRKKYEAPKVINLLPVEVGGERRIIDRRRGWGQL